MPKTLKQQSLKFQIPSHYLKSNLRLLIERRLQAPPLKLTTTPGVRGDGRGEFLPSGSVCSPLLPQVCPAPATSQLQQVVVSHCLATANLDQRETWLNSNVNYFKNYFTTIKRMSFMQCWAGRQASDTDMSRSPGSRPAPLVLHDKSNPGRFQILRYHGDLQAGRYARWDYGAVEDSGGLGYSGRCVSDPPNREVAKLEHSS